MALAKDTSIHRLVPVAERVATEGEPYGPVVFQENVTATDGFVLGALVLPSLSRAFYIESVTISSNKLLVIQVLLGNNATQTTAQQVHRVLINPGQPVTIPIRQVFRPHQTTSPNTGLTIGNFTIRKALDATPTGAYVYVSTAGFSLYDDLSYGADRVALVVGDSILNGTAGITQKSKSMEWLTRGYFQAAGSNVRMINKSISGSTTSDHEARRVGGVYDFPRVDYLHYQLGTNDAGAGTSASVAQTNLAAMIAWKQQRYPNAKMVVYGATPRENNTYEANLVGIRSAQQAAVTAAADPKVLFCSLAAAFDRTNTANFAASDTTGDHLHPVDSGHAAAYSLISAFLAAQNVKL